MLYLEFTGIGKVVRRCVNNKWVIMEYSSATIESVSTRNLPLKTVDYQICASCGFRLMRVETYTIREKVHLMIHCPICGFAIDEHGNYPGRKMTPAERLMAFEIWLVDHDLSTDILENSYHLNIDNFFAKTLP
jgi:hypothetical protein